MKSSSLDIVDVMITTSCTVIYECQNIPRQYVSNKYMKTIAALNIYLKLMSFVFFLKLLKENVPNCAGVGVGAGAGGGSTFCCIHPMFHPLLEMQFQTKGCPNITPMHGSKENL